MAQIIRSFLQQRRGKKQERERILSYLKSQNPEETAARSCCWISTSSIDLSSQEEMTIG